MSTDYADSESDVLVVDRRRNSRRSERLANATDESKGERRKNKERRRQIDPTTCERDYTDKEVAFMKAMDEYKRRSGRQFPTWSEVLEVLYNMGYRQVAEPTELVIKSK